MGRTPGTTPAKPVIVTGSIGVAQARMTLAGCLVLVVLVLAAFLPATGNGFINLDDNLYVTQNPWVQNGLSWEGLRWAFQATDSSNWHPVTWLSHMADCQIFGVKAWGHHLTSVVLHALNTVLVYLLFRALTGAAGRSFMVALLFGLHPLRVESVAWVAERKDVLSGFFFLLTLLAYARYAQGVKERGERREERRTTEQQAATQPSAIFNLPSSLFYLLALLCFALGLMSKPMLVTTPFVLLLLDYWPLRRELSVEGRVSRVEDSGRSAALPVGGARKENVSRVARRILQLIFEKVPFFALALASSVVTFVVQRSAGAVAQTLPLSARVENVPVAYCRYLATLFWPAHLCVVYPHPDYWPAILVGFCSIEVLGISIVAVLLWQRRPYFPVGWLWFAGTLVPVIGLVQVGYQSMADRYTYLPIIGVLLVVVWGTCDVVRSAPASTFFRRGKEGGVRRLGFALPAVSAVAGLICMVLTWRQISYWKDSETLFRRALAVTTNNWLAQGSLGNALEEQGRADEAIEHYREALKLYPEDRVGLANLAVLLRREGRLDEATRLLEAALRRRPDNALAHNEMGMVLAAKGLTDQAIGQVEESVRLMPDNPEAQHNLGVLLAMKDRIAEAIPHYQQAIRLRPNYAKAHKNLGLALARQGNLDGAIAQLQEAIRLQPDFAEAKKYLDAALAMKNGTKQPATRKQP